MKKFKAIICIVVICLMMAGGIFSIFYFSRDSENKKVVVTTFPIYDICRQILGNEEDLMLLQDDGVDVHSYQPTAKDIVSISNSELFIFIGGHSDSWVGNVVRSSENVNLKELCLIDHVNALEKSSSGIIESDDEHEEHKHHHDSEDGYDEHIWLSIKNVILMTEVILTNLIDVFPHMEQVLRENASNYILELKELDDEYAEVCEGKNKTIVLADRFPFLYLANDYDINFLSAFGGCSSDSEASVEVVTGLIEKINNEELNNICILETSDQKNSIAQSVVGDHRCRRGVQILVLNSCQSVSNSSLESLHYLDVMRNNLEIFRKALNNETN